MKSYYKYESCIGTITLVSESDAITALKFGFINCTGEYALSPVIELAIQQLTEYFNCKRTAFSLHLNPSGTTFQLSVWKALCNIHYGQTRTYKQIAIDIGSPGACRAVGMANNRNPIPIIIPCHRVIGANGSLTGYAGGLDIKKQLLELEQTGQKGVFCGL